MSNDLVNARPEDVKKLAKALEQYQAKIADASKQARSAINSANWHDSQKDRFTSRFQDFEKRTNSFVGGEVKQMVKQLNALAYSLERAKAQRF